VGRLAISLAAVAALAAATGAGAARDRFGRPLPEGANARMGTDLVHHAGYHALAFSPDGRRILAGGFDGEVTLWDAKTARPLAHVATLYPVFLTGFRANTMFAMDTNELVVFDAGSRDELFRVSIAFDQDQTSDGALSRDGKMFAWVGAFAGAPMWLLDAKTGEPIRPIRVTRPRGISWSPDGRKVAIACADGAIRVAAVATSNDVVSFPTGETSLDVVDWSPDGTLLAAGGAEGAITLRAPADGRLVRTLPGVGWVHALAFSPDGTRLASVQERLGLRVIDTKTGETLFARPASMRVHRIAFSPDGRRLAWWDDRGGHDELRVADLTTETVSGDLARHEGGVNFVAFTRGGRRVLSAGADGAVRLWNAATGDPVALLARVSSTNGRGARVSVGEAIAIDGEPGAFDEEGRAIDASDPRAVSALSGLMKPFTPARAEVKDLVIVSRDDGVSVAHPDGTYQRRLAPERAWAVALSADGKRAAAGFDAETRVWSVETGKPLATFASGPVRAIAFSADGTRVVTGGADGTLVVWAVR